MAKSDDTPELLSGTVSSGGKMFVAAWAVAVAILEIITGYITISSLSRNKNASIIRPDHQGVRRYRHSGWVHGHQRCNSIGGHDLIAGPQIEQQGTLLDMLRLLTDKAYRDRIVMRISDDVVRSFWTNEFATWNSQYRTEAVSSVTNKMMPFLTSRQPRAITSGTNKQSLYLRRVMDEQQILIINLSRGRLGQDNSATCRDCSP